jgi:methylthioribose-1-phosphate isomerase
VLCTESRPACEGAALALDLTRHGIPTSLTTEAMAFYLMLAPPTLKDRVRLVLVGADSISRHGVTNKAGTLGLALAARSCSLPLYVLAGSEKFIPDVYPVKKAILHKPGGEILSPIPQGLTIINRYFDITPLQYVTATVSEKGPLSYRGLRASLRGLRIHPDLMKIVRAL